MFNCFAFKAGTIEFCRKVMFFKIFELSVIGVLTIIIAGYTLGTSTVYTSNEQTDKYLKALWSGISIGGFISGSMTIFLVILAGLVLKYRNRWTGVPYMFFTFCISFLSLGIGITILAPFSKEGGSYYVACSLPDPQTSLTGNQSYGILYNFMVNKMMCSEYCPCHPNDKSTIQKIYPSDFSLQPFGRNWQNLANYNITQNNTLKTLFTEGNIKNIVYPLVFTTTPNPKENIDYYTNYPACYERVIKPMFGGIIDAKGDLNQSISLWIQQDWYSIIQGAESINCSAWCAQPLFSSQKKISAGLPTQDGTMCTLLWWQQKATGAAIVSIIQGSMLFIGFFVAIPLCCGKVRKEEEYDDI